MEGHVQRRVAASEDADVLLRPDVVHQDLAVGRETDTGEGDGDVDGAAGGRREGWLVEADCTQRQGEREAKKS